MVIHILPRFYLGGLLWYAAMPFLYQNLIDTYLHMEFKEYVIVLVIFITVVIFDLLGNSAAMLIAVVVGFLTSTLVFMWQYARVSVIREQYNLASGLDVVTNESSKHYSSKVVRPYKEEALLERAANRVAYIQLEGFIFFASATQVLNRIKNVIQISDDLVNSEKTRERIGEYMRLKYLVIDFEHVQSRSQDGTTTVGMDYSGLKTFVEVKRIVKEAKLLVWFTGLSDDLMEAFRTENVLAQSLEEEDEMIDAGEEFVIRTAEDMDRGAERIETFVLERAAKLRRNWLLFESFKKVHVEAQQKKRHQVFDTVLGGAAGSNLYEYAAHQVYDEGEFIVLEGTIDNHLYLLQYGKVTAYTAQTDGITEEEREHGQWKGVVKRLRTMGSGAVINDDMLFRNTVVGHSVVANERSVIWKLHKDFMQKMERVNPKLAVAIHHHILKFSLVCRERLEKEVSTLESLDHSNSVKNKNKKEKNTYWHKTGKMSSHAKTHAQKQMQDAQNDGNDGPRRGRLKDRSDGHVGHGKGHSSHGLAEAISKKIQETHWNWSHQKFNKKHEGERHALDTEEFSHAEEEGTLASLHDAQHHHGHRFHHIGSALEIMDHDNQEESKILKDRPWWLDVKPHVSSVMNKSAQKHFDMWAADYYFDKLEEAKRRRLSESNKPRRSLSQTTDDDFETESESFKRKSYRGGRVVQRRSSGSSASGSGRDSFSSHGSHDGSVHELSNDGNANADDQDHVAVVMNNNNGTDDDSDSGDDTISVMQTKSTPTFVTKSMSNEASNSILQKNIKSFKPAAKLIKVAGSEGPAKRASARPGGKLDVFAHPAPEHPSAARSQRISPHTSPMHRGQTSPAHRGQTSPTHRGQTSPTHRGQINKGTSPKLPPLSPRAHPLLPVGRGSFSKLTSSPSPPGSPKSSSGGSFDEGGGEDGGRDTKKFIDVETIQRVLEELGLYPTLLEVNSMHLILSKSDDRAHRNGKADFPEFLQMVELLTLGQFDDVAKIQLHKVFRKFGIDPPLDDEENIRHEESVLDQEGLGRLMDALGHHGKNL